MKDDENAPRGRETMLSDLLAARADAASVLVVDDAEANARVFAERVRDAGFEPTVVTSVNDTAAALATTPRGFAAAAVLLIPAALGGAGELLGIDWLTRAGVLVTALGLPFAGWFASPQR